jgi:hypothetical protein
MRSFMATSLEQYVQRRVKELRAEGKSDYEILQQLSGISGARKEVRRILAAEKEQS